MKYFLVAVGSFALGYFVCAKTKEQTYIDQANASAAESWEWYKSKVAEHEGTDPDLDNSLEENEEFNQAVQATEEVVRAQQVIRLSQAEKVMPVYRGTDTDEPVTHDTVDFRPPDESREQFVAYYKMHQQGSKAAVTPSAVIEVGDEDRPYVFNADKFQEYESGYQQDTLNFYTGCGTVTNQLDECFSPEEINNMLGSTLEELMNAPDGVTTMYVRAPLMEFEYEICRYNGTYNEVVGNNDDMEPAGGSG